MALVVAQKRQRNGHYQKIACAQVDAMNDTNTVSRETPTIVSTNN